METIRVIMEMKIDGLPLVEGLDRMETSNREKLARDGDL